MESPSVSKSAGRVANFVLGCAWFVAVGVPLVMYLLDLNSMAWFWGMTAATYGMMAAVVGLWVYRARRRLRQDALFLQ
jgi:uncharacterized membrane protein